MSRKTTRNINHAPDPNRVRGCTINHATWMRRAKSERLAGKPIPFVNRHTERAYYKKARLQFTRFTAEAK